MDTIEAMTELDRLVEQCREGERYPVARSLYEASLAGLLAVSLPPTTMYAWVLKWATLPEARGRSLGQL